MRDSWLIPPHRILPPLFQAYRIMITVALLYLFHHTSRAEATDNGSTSGTTVALDKKKTSKLKPVLKPQPTLTRLDPVYKDSPISQGIISTGTGNTGLPDPGKKPTDPIESPGSEESPGKIPEIGIHPVAPDDRAVSPPFDEAVPMGSIQRSAMPREPEFEPSNLESSYTMYSTGTDTPDEEDDSSVDPASTGFPAEKILNHYMHLDDHELMLKKLAEFISSQDNPILINQARLKLGRCLAETGQMDDARHEYELILDDRSATRDMKAGAMAGKADILSRQMDFQQALSIWRNIKKTYPEYLERANHLVRFGLTVLAADNAEVATKILNEADLLDSELPEAPVSMLGRALASELQGDPKTSRLILRNLVKRYPDSREAGHARVRLRDLNRPILSGSQDRRKVDSK